MLTGVTSLAIRDERGSRLSVDAAVCGAWRLVCGDPDCRLPLIIRQSMMKNWQKCPLLIRWEREGLQREQSGSLIYGSIIHDCVLWMEVNQDLDGAIDRFKQFWTYPEQLDPEYRVDYYVKGTSWTKFMEKGPDLLTKWWAIISWETDLVLGREYEFNVPIGNGHILHGTIDKLTVRWNAATEQWIILCSDYKTNNKVPTYGYLEEDLQFTAYSYATMQPEFWFGMFPGNAVKGLELWEKYKDFPRHGEWVQLSAGKRMDAGIREERHYNRFIMACNQMADSIDMGIYVPTLSGESCRYCEFRKQCGLPEIMEEEI